MKVVLLAGGQGTRLREETEFKPKPMVEIGGYPIIWHIMKIYASQGFKDFIICGGYKQEIIKNYFLNYKCIENDFSINLKSGELKIFNKNDLDWNVTIVDTGLNTQTGGRLLRIKEFINNERFMATYGDGLADVNLKLLLDAHINNKVKFNSFATLTSVLSKSKFGEIEFSSNSPIGGKILSFEEKSRTSWINGGFFVFENSIFDLINGDDDPLESGLLCKLSANNKLGLYQHTGFWGCMDTYKDTLSLIDLWNNNIAPWKIW